MIEDIFSLILIIIIVVAESKNSVIELAFETLCRKPVSVCNEHV